MRRSPCVAYDRVDDPGDRLLEVGQRDALVADRELEIGHVLVAHAAPDRAFSGDRGGLVPAATDQVEERCGELVRANGRLLAQKRRHECRLRVRGRLLLVLAVVARLPLAPADEPDEQHQRESRPLPEEEQVESCSPEVPLRVVDALAVVFVGALRPELVGDDLLQAVLVPDLRPGGRGEQAPREDHAHLDELVSRNARCLQQRAIGEARDGAPNPRRAAPDPIGGRKLRRLWELHRRRQAAERGRPVVPPDVQVDVDDIVVGDRESAEAVGDVEGPPLGVRGVVPDDPDALVDSSHAVGVRQVEATELRVGAGPVERVSLADGHVVDRLALAERDVPIGPAEGPVEVESDLLPHEQRAVRLDLHGDVGERKRIGLRRSRRRPQQRGRAEREEGSAEPAQVWNCTDGASRVAPSVSK